VNINLSPAKTCRFQRADHNLTVGTGKRSSLRLKESTMSVRHCGRMRKSRAYWLLPRVGEEIYKHVVLEVSRCPSCGQFILEWHGVTWALTRTPSHRILFKHHEEWVARTRIDLDDMMDTSQWMTLKGAVVRVKGSLSSFPFTMGYRRVR
jgi:hypothetical protein